MKKDALYENGKLSRASISGDGSTHHEKKLERFLTLKKVKLIE